MGFFDWLGDLFGVTKTTVDKHPAGIDAIVNREKNLDKQIEKQTEPKKPAPDKSKVPAKPVSSDPSERRKEPGRLKD